MRALILLLPLLFACSDKGGGGGGDDTGSGGDDGTGDGGGPQPDVTVIPIGPAPWDGFTLDVEDGSDPTPIVQDATGADVAVAATSGDAWSVSWWAGSDGELAPGDYTVPGIDGSIVGYDETFTVGEYGTATDFDPTSILGNAYEIDLSSIWLFGDLLDGLADDDRLFFRVDASAATWADLRVIYEQGDGACLAQNAGGDLAGSVLSWDADRLDVASTPLIESFSPRWRLGFDPTGTSFAGLEGQAEVDLRKASAWVTSAGDEEALCRAWGALGGTCGDCGSGVMGCAVVGFRGGQGTLVDAPDYLDAIPPDCGLLLQEDTIPDMDVDCSCSSGVGGAVGGIWLAGLLGLWRRRRDT